MEKLHSLTWREHPGKTKGQKESMLSKQKRDSSESWNYGAKADKSEANGKRKSS